MKDFKKHFFMLYNKVVAREHFAFLRFSDGELRIMQNLELVLAADHFQIGDKKSPGHYVPEDYKHFDPKQHASFRDKLMESYTFLKDNYYVGLSCRCCVGEADFKEMCDWYKGDVNTDYLTWSNLWVNSNYPLFVKYMIPEFKYHDIVYIVNENAKLENLPFKVKKSFRVGPNCIVNDIGLIEIIREWIKENKVTNHVFLFSASSLSNVLQYELFKEFDQNTYIDIGTTLNPYMDMKGRRSYLIGGDSLNKTCIW